MKKRKLSILFLIFFTFLIVPIASTYAHTVSKEVIEKCKKSVVMIEVVCSHGKSTMGSGFAFDPLAIDPFFPIEPYENITYISTAYHVVDHVKELFVKYEGNFYNAVPIKFKRSLDNPEEINGDDFNDQAIIKVYDIENAPPPLELGELPETTDVIASLGFASFRKYSLKFGYATDSKRPLMQSLTQLELYGVAYETIFLSTDYIQMELRIEPGESGGPLVNERKEVVGSNLIMSGIAGSDFIGPSKNLKQLVKCVKTGYLPKRGYLGVSTLNLTNFLASPKTKQININNFLETAFELNIDSLREPRTIKNITGVMVLSTEDKSPAKKINLRPGDIITHFDNKPVSGDGIEFIEMVRSAGPKKISMTIYKNHSNFPEYIDVYLSGDGSLARTISEEKKSHQKPIIIIHPKK